VWGRLILIPLIVSDGLRGFIGEFHPNEDMNDAGIFMLIAFVFVLATASPVVDVVVSRADGELGVAGYSREEGVRSGGNGYGGAARQFRARHGRHFAKIITNLASFGIGPRILDGCLHRKKQALHDMLAGCLVLRRDS